MTHDSNQEPHRQQENPCFDNECDEEQRHECHKAKRCLFNRQEKAQWIDNLYGGCASHSAAPVLDKRVPYVECNHSYSSCPINWDAHNKAVAQQAKQEERERVLGIVERELRDPPEMAGLRPGLSAKNRRVMEYVKKRLEQS